MGSVEGMYVHVLAKPTFLTPTRLARDGPAVPILEGGALERRSLLKILAARASFCLRSRPGGC